MTSFISIFITVGICLAIYAYIKKKYAAQIALLEEQIANLSLDILHHKAQVKKLDDKVFVAEKEVSSYKSRLETMVDINKELSAKNQSTSVNSTKPVDTTLSAKPLIDSTESTEHKKRGRKPGSKKPFYKKKSGGNPS
jgi:7,8-dihydro-6-hydroxymethylpterin-pyrophosphokinase